MFFGGQTKEVSSYAQRNTFHCNGQILNIILLFMMRQVFYSPTSWRGKEGSLISTYLHFWSPQETALTNGELGIYAQYV